MDTWTMIDEIKSLDKKEEQIKFIEDQLKTNKKYSGPLHGDEYASKPKALLYMISQNGKITTEVKEKYYETVDGIPTTSDIFDKLAEEVNRLKGF